jgi:hypothetical protein
MPEKKYTYKVLPGRRFGPYDELGPGDTVELTANEAEGFPKTLALVKAPDAPAEEPPDKAAHLESLTVEQLRSLPEWDEVEPPRPTKKDEIVKAILEVKAAK